MGNAVVESLAASFPEAELRLLPKQHLDIADKDQVEKLFISLEPDILVNLAAYTKVDLAEKEKEEAFRANATGPETLARACHKSGCRLIHISTDYVFDGRKKEAYLEDDPVNPIGHYGATKLEGEKRIMDQMDDYLILRVSWLYGPGGPNFVRTMITKGKQLGKLKVVNDQTGAPTYTKDVANAISRLIPTSASGVYHVTNAGKCTWYEYAMEIFSIAGLDHIEVSPVTTSEFPTPAKRPENSLMDNSKYNALTGKPMRHWKEALADYLSMGEEGL